jgi:hypothetical protein
LYHHTLVPAACASVDWADALARRDFVVVNKNEFMLWTVAVSSPPFGTTVVAVHDPKHVELKVVVGSACISYILSGQQTPLEGYTSNKHH